MKNAEQVKCCKYFYSGLNQVMKLVVVVSFHIGKIQSEVSDPHLSLHEVTLSWHTGQMLLGWEQQT